MGTRIGAVLIGLLVASSVSTAPPTTGPLGSFTIHPVPQLFSGWTTEPAGATGRFLLELGESPDGALIELTPAAGDARELSLQYQLESSMTIMNEGPHLDLIDWKHGRSEWREIEQLDELRFRMPTIPYDPTLLGEFPDYTVEELIEVVHAAGGERWSSLVRERPGVGDGHVGIGLSTLRIRVQAYDPAPAGWVTVFTVEIGVALGC